MARRSRLAALCLFAHKTARNEYRTILIIAEIHLAVVGELGGMCMKILASGSDAELLR